MFVQCYFAVKFQCQNIVVVAHLLLDTDLQAISTLVGRNNHLFRAALRKQLQ